MPPGGGGCQDTEPALHDTSLNPTLGGQMSSGIRVLVAAVAASLTIACNHKPANRGGAGGPASAGMRDIGADDVRVATRIGAAYFTAADIKAQVIDVAVKDGAVTLKGSVPSEQTRLRAANVAGRVEGVSRVNNQLTVNRTPRSPDQPAGDSSDRTSPSCVTSVQAQYFVSPDVGTSNIDVSTSTGGLVTLTGDVSSPAERDAAVQIARATDGVTGVNDRLRVKGETGTGGSTPTVADVADALKDAWITSQVESKLFVDPDVKGRAIEVETKERVVTLRGSVGSPMERRRALMAARQIDGVIDVRDEMRLVRSEAKRIRTGRRLDDKWIRTKVQSEFFADEGFFVALLLARFERPPNRAEACSDLESSMPGGRRHFPGRFRRRTAP